MGGSPGPETVLKPKSFVWPFKHKETNNKSPFLSPGLLGAKHLHQSPLDILQRLKDKARLLDKGAGLEVLRVLA